MTEFDDYGRELLEPIVYERAGEGWRVPDHERARWNAAPIRPASASRRVDTETLSYEAINDLLEPWYPGLPLRARLAVAYERDPVAVSRLTLGTLDEADHRGPCGLLWVRLGALDPTRDT